MVAVPSPLEEAIDRVSDRLRLRVFVGALCHGIVVASVADIVYAILDHFLIFPASLALVSLALFGLAVLYAVVRMAMTRLTTFAVARLVEDKMGLKERMSSALSLDIGSAGIDPVFRRLQHQDADLIAKQVNGADIAAIANRKQVIGAATSVAALLLSIAILHLMPADLTRRAEQIVVAKEASLLADTARRIQRTAPFHSDAQVQAQELEKLAKQLQGGMPRREARQHVQQMAQNVAYRQQQLAGPGHQAPLTPAEAGQAIQQAAGSQAGGDSGTASGDAKQIILKGAHEMQQTNDAETLPAMLRRLANHVESRASTPADQQGIANQLDKLSDGLDSAGMPLTKGHVDKASQALRSGDSATAASELRKAADEAEREGQNAQGLKDVRQALQQSAQSLGGQGAGQSGDQSGSQGQQSSGDQNGSQGGQSASQGGGQQGEGGQSGQGQQSGQGGQSGQNGQSNQSGSQGGQGGSQAGQGSQSGSQSSGGSSSQGGQSGQKSGSGEPGEGSNQSQDNGSEGGQSSDGGAPADGGGSGPGGRISPGKLSPGGRDSGQDQGGGDSVPFHGAPRQIDDYDPTKSPGYNKLNLPHPESGGASVVHKTGRYSTPPKNTAPSAVPYSDEYPAAHKSAEEAMDRQSVPPAYRKAVESYFQGISPPK